MSLLHKTSPADNSGIPAADRTSSGNNTPTPSRPPFRFRPSAALGWAFVVLVLATGPLELTVPDQNGSAYFSAAGLGGLAVMGAIALAERRRARAMVRVGMRVESVEVGFLRGRILTTDQPSTPRDLTRISWAGPLALLAAAIVLGAVGGLVFPFADSNGLRLLGASALFSAMGVASLGIAELLPAPGSPGSQLIFARAWRRTGERGTAVLPTAKAGLVTGWALLIAGVWVMLLLSIAGLWIVFVGGMVIAGSKVTMAGARTRQQLTGVRAKDVMSPAPPEVSAFATAESAFADVALPSRASVLVVRESDGSFGGIVPVPQLAAVPGDDRSEVRVRRLALPPEAIATVDADAAMEAVLETLARHPLGGGVALVRGEPGTFVGMITPADVTRTIELMQAARSGRPRGTGGSSDNPYA